jgi:uncharacterized pyridoxal phosphate-dependent enzyme
MDVYERLGVRKTINAYGTLTRLGGSLMEPPVLEAMAEAARHFVDLNELQQKAGEHVAQLLGVEAAYICSGAAAGLMLSTAACITGTDPANIRRLPGLQGLKNEVLIQKSHRNGYDHAVRQVGVSLIEFGLIKETFSWELRNAITERTAAVVHFVEFENHRNLPLEQVIAIAKEFGVPVIVDAAAEIPPVENLRRFVEMGADLVVYSGGKDIRGPQSSGLILGRGELIRACALNGSPNYSLGRPMKVGKEEMVGLVVALERYLKQDFGAEAQLWEGMVARMVQLLSGLPGVQARRVSPGEPGVQPNWIPRVYVDWDPQVEPLDRETVRQRLLDGEPPVAVGETATGLYLNPHALQPGEEEVVGRRVREVFLEARLPKS